MGIETMIALSVGSGIMGAVSANKQAKANADAAVAQGNLELAKMKKQASALQKATASQVGSQKTSFLSSGLSLEGTPSDVITETYDTGVADLLDLNLDMKATANSYNQKSKNYITAGRAEAMNSLVSGVSSAALIGYNSGYFSDGFGFGSNTITAEAGSSPNVISTSAWRK
jgi:hypothetical protein